MESKRCSACGEIKPTTQFYRNTHNKDGLLHQCKQCHDDYCKRGKAGSLVVPLAPGRRAVLKLPYSLTAADATKLTRVLLALTDKESNSNQGE